MHEGGGITYTTTIFRHWQGLPGMDQHCSSSDQHGDHLAVKQLVCRYVAAHREEERKLVDDMLAIRIIHESSSLWSSPTVLVKK